MVDKTPESVFLSRQKKASYAIQAAILMFSLFSETSSNDLLSNRMNP